MARGKPLSGRAGAFATVLALVLGMAPAASAEPARGPVTDLPLPRFVSTRAGATNARRGPGLDQRVDWSFRRAGWPLEVTAEYRQWRRVRDADGEGGWVHQSLLSGVRTVLVRSEGMTALRTGADDGTLVRAYLEPGVVAKLDRCGEARCLIEAAGIAGWIARDALWGVGPAEDAAE